jgi:hypothetical protein
LESGVGLIGIPSMLQRGNSLGIQTELAIQNVVPKPGFTDFAIFLYDQNGLIDYVCEKLNEKQVEYIDLSTWGWVQPGFKGSAVISATFWEHDVFADPSQCRDFDPRNGDDKANQSLPGDCFLRNVVGLAAVKIERVVPTGSLPTPGDLAAGSEGFPIPTGQRIVCRLPDGSLGIGFNGTCVIGDPVLEPRPTFDFEGFPPVCPGVPANCNFTLALVLILCPPNDTTEISTYTGAEVTVTNLNNQQRFSTEVLPNGLIIVPIAITGNPYRIEVHPVLQPVPFPGADLDDGQTLPAPVDVIEMAGFVQNIVVPCRFETPGDLPFEFVTFVTLTPPPGVIEGYVVAACGPPLGAPQGGRDIQLWIPPSNPGNQGGTFLTSTLTSTEGFFQFRGVNPCLVYELKNVVGTLTTVTVGVLAGSPLTTIGTEGVGQKYILSQATGAICDVLPDPPGLGDLP